MRITSNIYSIGLHNAITEYVPATVSHISQLGPIDLNGRHVLNILTKKKINALIEFLLFVSHPFVFKTLVFYRIFLEAYYSKLN